MIAKLAKEKEAAKRKSKSTSNDTYNDVDADESFVEKSKNTESTNPGGGIRIRSFAVDPTIKSSLSGPKKLK